tara:strand:+ start:262 stop:846 length:585 start_codon:yes stop_codon:yes gene_type:complete
MIIVYFSYISSLEQFNNYYQNPSISQFELINVDIPIQIHKLYINDSMTIIPFGAIKGYLPDNIQNMNIPDNTQCIYTYALPQKENLYDYDLNLSYLDRPNSHLDLVSPYTDDILYCETNEQDIPMCSILSCNKYKTTSLHRNAMSILIRQNNKESIKKKLHNTRVNNNNKASLDNTLFNSHVSESNDIYNKFNL